MEARQGGSGRTGQKMGQRSRALQCCALAVSRQAPAFLCGAAERLRTYEPAGAADYGVELVEINALLPVLWRLGLLQEALA